jgi:hypothetical protein
MHEHRFPPVLQPQVRSRTLGDVCCDKVVVQSYSWRIHAVAVRCWWASQGEVPIDCKIEHEQRFVHATAHGVVALRDILDYFDAIAIN